jgi:phosphatidylglycerophosphate synthase
MENLSQYKFDDKIVNAILNNTNIFENIEPNHITLFGIAINFIIFYYLFFKKINPNLNLLIGLALIRWFVDCLDGNVARKYKKTSELGNTLDTISDIIIQIIFILFICYNIENYKIRIIIFSIFLMYIYTIICNYSIFDNHDNVKNGKSIMDSLCAFFVNNSILSYIIAFVIALHFRENKILDLGELKSKFLANL